MVVQSRIRGLLRAARQLVAAARGPAVYARLGAPGHERAPALTRGWLEPVSVATADDFVAGRIPP